MDELFVKFFKLGYQIFMEDLTKWRDYNVDGEFGIDWYSFWSNIEMENDIF